MNMRLRPSCKCGGKMFIVTATSRTHARVDHVGNIAGSDRESEYHVEQATCEACGEDVTDIERAWMKR